MRSTSRRTGRAAPAPAPAPGTPRLVAVVDMGASAIRLLLAEVLPDGTTRTLEEVSRGALLGKDTFSRGRLSSATIQSALRILQNFRAIVEGYGPVACRAVATSAVREAENRDTFLDRIRLRTGFEFEIIDGPEENRLTWLAVRDVLAQRAASFPARALLMEIGGGSADLSFLRSGEPVRSGTYPLGSIRLRQQLGAFRGSHEAGMRILVRNIRNVVEDIRRDMPLQEARLVIGLGADLRYAADRILGDNEALAAFRAIPAAAFESFCEEMLREDVDSLIERHGLHQAGAETLVPALLTCRELLRTTRSSEILVPEASLRKGLLLDMARDATGQASGEELGRLVRASAESLGEKYGWDAAHGRHVAALAVSLFDQLAGEHGLGPHDRLLLEVAALLHDLGVFVGRRAHHKHAQYILSVSEVFGLSRDDMVIVGTIARYHRRALPQKAHLPYATLDRDTRVAILKLAAILRVANALDAERLQKITSLRLEREEDAWRLVVTAAGEVTMERQALIARADLFEDVYGTPLAFREEEPVA